MIEIHTTALTANALGGNGHTFGIENIPGTRAKPVPGRNQAEGFTMTNESWRFTKGYTLLARKNPLTISWSPTTALVPTNRVNPTATPTSTTTYILSVFDSLCYFYDTVTITIRNKDTVNQTFSLCGGSIVRVGTRSYTTSGFYRDTLLNSAGCDSFVNTTLVIIPSDSLNQIISICDDSSFTYNGRTHTISGIYSDTFINRNGCDSIMYTYLNIRPRSFVTQNIRFCIGNSINVGVNTYSTSGTYRDTLTNILSCDSIITTNLIVDTFPVGRQTIHICPSSSYTVGSNTYTSAGVYTDTLLNPGRCDTIVITNLIIDTLPFSYQTIAICPDASYTIGSRTYSVPGSYNDTFPKPGFCDTIIVTTIIYKPISSSTITPSFCDGDTLRVGTSRYTTSGTRYDTLVNYVGCDSIVTSILTVYPNVVTIIPVTICYDQFYFAAGANRNTTNTYYDSLLSINGCDSVIRTNLTVIPLVTTTRTISICFGDSLFVQGANRGSTGTYYDTLVAISGCDSLLITNLVIKSHSYTTQNPRICNGSSFAVGVNSYTAGGTYQDTLVNYLGCDSVITTILSVDTVILSKTSRNIRCFSGNDGQIVGSAVGGVAPYQYNIGGAWQASGTFNSLVAGTYTLTVRDFNGCTANTSITLTQPLRILPIIAVNTAPLCNGGSDGSVQVGTTNGTAPFQYSLNNISYQVSNTLSGLSAGNYRAYVQDSLGCIDSINFTITEPAPIVIDVVPTQNKCNNDATGAITLSPRGGRTPYEYSIDGGASFVGTNTFAGLVAGVYNIVVRDRNNCTASATTTLNNPTLFTIDASGVDVLCWDSDNGKINILPNGGTTPYQSYGISQNNVVFSTSNVPKFANLTSGFYYVEGYDANGCRATDTASIGRPPVDTFAFDIDSTSCYGAQYLDGSIIVSALANPPYTWTIDGGASQNFGIFYGLGAGYHLIIATNANGCVDSLIQFVPFPPPVIVDVVPDTVYLELGASQQINVNVQNAINPTYVWNTLQGLSCNDCPNPIVSPFNDMIYTIRVYDHSHPLNSSECYGEATLYVMVEEHIKSYVPNAFTPANTDGINDQLMVYGEGIKKLHFTIYDRWGELLFESNRQDIGWDGSYKGKILGPGVYIYYVEAEYLDSKKEYYQGSVTLLK
jgi:gliding motility-associated-like protein